jgi:hypothetical protein
MSFQPLKEGSLSTSLFGFSDVSKFSDISREENLFDKRIHGLQEKQSKISYTLIIIIVSAIIFVTIVSIYEVIRTVIKNYYAKIALTDPMSNNKQTIVSNYDALKANFYFSLFCVVTGIVLIWILLKLL